MFLIIKKRENEKQPKEIKLANQGNIRILSEKENYKYLWILEAETIK